MTTELEIITPHLRGSCLMIGNQLHGLFKLAGRKRDTRDDAWLKVRPERASDRAYEETGS